MDIKLKDKKWWIGTSGWSYKHWQGIFYPLNLKNSDWLGYYVSHFPTVEVNSTFYRIPFKGMITSWLKKTPNDFRFVIKGSRRITHYKKLRDFKDPLQVFLERLEPLREKILCILWQLPPSLKRDIVLMEEFLSQLPGNFRYALEFRHASWIEDNTFQLLERYQVAHCTVSAPKFPCNLTTTTDFAYIRFHGITGWYNYNYTEDDLLWWMENILMIGKRTDKVLVYFNNDYNAYAVKNALRLKALLEN